MVMRELVMVVLVPHARDIRSWGPRLLDEIRSGQEGMP